MRILFFVSVLAILLSILALVWVLAKYKRDEEAKKEPKNKRPFVDI